ncbi:MAG: SAM-dependent methyltransferase [Isosphaeraceae bacterium]|nr:MAG: SAM-dependent methyltransferase [Isosphaeraceae bacterium]
MTRSGPRCRWCSEPLRDTFVDLGKSPLCERYLTAEELDCMEPFYPLHVRVCRHCWLVQLEAYVPAEEIFTEYAYFSSYSESWIAHGRAYAQSVINRFGLNHRSLVVEAASNDGYLLQHFAARGIPVLGIEPARNVAAVALERGIPTCVEFLTADLARRLATEGTRADLLIANNVLAHVPDLRDFVAGLTHLLAPHGVLTLEFPHLQRLIEGNQFDTIYHEHFSYFSFTSAVRILSDSGFSVFDVEELSTHGGSLRVYAQPADNSSRPVLPAVPTLLEREARAGVTTLAYYGGFSERVQQTKRRLLSFLISARDAGRHVVGYGAPGKGNTLLNYCGIRSDLLDYTVDRNPYKQGKFLPGTHIPIHHPGRIAETRPDFILILPWNLQDEIVTQLDYVRTWGGRLAVPIPEPRVLDGLEPVPIPKPTA